jgi:hypothetical protein
VGAGVEKVGSRGVACGETCPGFCEKALELAEPENRIASFVGEGAMMERLFQLALVKSIAPAFVHRLLAAFEALRKHKPVPAPATEVLPEPLSERELEVL